MLTIFPLSFFLVVLVLRGVPSSRRVWVWCVRWAGGICGAVVRQRGAVFERGRAWRERERAGLVNEDRGFERRRALRCVSSMVWGRSRPRICPPYYPHGVRGCADVRRAQSCSWSVLTIFPRFFLGCACVAWGSVQSKQVVVCVRAGRWSGLWPVSLIAEHGCVFAELSRARRRRRGRLGPQNPSPCRDLKPWPRPRSW